MLQVLQCITCPYSHTVCHPFQLYCARCRWRTLASPRVHGHLTLVHSTLVFDSPCSFVSVLHVRGCCCNRNVLCRWRNAASCLLQTMFMLWPPGQLRTEFKSLECFVLAAYFGKKSTTVQFAQIRMRFVRRLQCHHARCRWRTLGLPRW